MAYKTIVAMVAGAMYSLALIAPKSWFWIPLLWSAFLVITLRIFQ